MSCENCKNEKDAVVGAAKESRLMADMVQAYDRQNKRLWACLMALCAAFVIFAGCVVWAIQNAQSVANEAVLNALETVAEMEVTTETTTTTTTQTVEGDSATINNVDGEQYNDEATNNGGGS